MAAWKQIAVSLVVLLAAAAAWVKFFPGAPEILARWGIDWAQAASAAGARSRTAKASGRRRRRPRPR